MTRLAKRGNLTESTGGNQSALSHTLRTEVSPSMSTQSGLQSIKGPVDFWADPFFNQHARKAFRAYASMQMQEMQSHVLRQVGRCESPLEAAFMAWWIVFQSTGGCSLDLFPQHEVTAMGRRYRLDFMVQPTPGRSYSMLLGLEAMPKVAIELDGHHYHEKTKKQVTKRNRRDRDLASVGWTVLHASFSEFHDDDVKATSDLMNDAEAPFYWAMKQRLLA